MKLTKSEAGRLGAEKSKLANAIAKQKRIDDYNSNPKICKWCNNSLTYYKRKNDFCSKSCGATFNNFKRIDHSNDKIGPPQRPKDRRPIIECFHCKCRTKNSKFCSMKCFVANRNSELELSVLSGTASSVTIKSYLIRNNGIECSKCHETHKLGEVIPIEIDHINGDFKDNRLENCRLLCPTCHAMTPTYKAKNVGKGRHSRRRRYKDGKSY
jgi:hypothetical protein